MEIASADWIAGLVILLVALPLILVLGSSEDFHEPQ
jgi:hypothetical protein